MSTVNSSSGNVVPIKRIRKKKVQEPEQEMVSGPKKIAIVGFTSSRNEAPYGDPEWELWGINNLHKQPDVDISKFHKWFDLHPRKTIDEDSEHVSWLKEGKLPCILWKTWDDFPSSVAYPKDEILDMFNRRYFTNSITWLVALAIAVDAEEIGVYGIDMAQSGEYSAQRPSCEWIIGIAEGKGIKVHIPETSDLLKATSLYGDGDDSFRIKMEARNKELQGLYQTHCNARDEHQAAALQLKGALEDVSYVLGVWTQPSVKREM